MIRMLSADANTCALYLFLSADHREAVYENLRLADADVACRFGDITFTQGSDSARSLADGGGRYGEHGGSPLGRVLAGDATGDQPVWLARRRGLGSDGARSRADEGGDLGDFAGKERCITYEAIYN